MDKKEEIYPLYRKIVYKILYKPLYNIVVLNLRHYSAFVPKIGDFSGKVDIYSKREVLNINRFPLVVFFRKKFSCAKSYNSCPMTL